MEVGDCVGGVSGGDGGVIIVGKFLDVFTR